MRTFNMTTTFEEKNATIMRWNPTSLLLNPSLMGSYMPPYELVIEKVECTIIYQ